MNRLIEFFVRQRVFSDLITVFIIVVGVASLFMMKREAFPNIKYDIITIRTVFPGASPEEVERLITNPLEQELKEVDGIKKVASVSREGVSMFIMQLDPDQTTEAEAKSDIQDVVDKFAELPEEAEDPIVTALESSIYPIIQVSLTSDLPDIEFRNLSREVEKKLEKIKDVAKVTATGMRDVEIRVEAELPKLHSLRISLEELITALRNQNVSIPGGTITGDSGEDVLIRTIGSFETVEDIENTIIRANDLAQSIRVKDVAKVRMDLEKTDQLFRTNGQSAINLTVMKKEKADSITVVELIKEQTKELEKEYEGRLKFRLIDDESVWIKMRLSTLSSNLLIGFILVLIVLSFLLPPVVAFMVSLGIPVAFMGTMIYFHNTDLSLNLLTMIGLIIVVGMLVDDAVVTTENAMRLYEEGESAENAAIKGAQQVVASVFGSVLTTVIAFLPLMFMTGIFGKYVKYIPIGVVVALIVSLAEAFFILPNHFARWMGKNKDRSFKTGINSLYFKTNEKWNAIVIPFYTKAVRKFIQIRYRVIGIIFVLLGISIFISTRIGFVLFPADGIEIFFITADAPLGTPLEKTSELLVPLEEIVLSLPKEELQDFTTQVGLQQKDPGDPNTKIANHVAMLVIYLTPEKERSRKADDIISELREKSKNIPNLKINFERIQGGPPVGKPISIGVKGVDYKEILELANIIKDEISKIPGTSDLELNHQLGKKELVVDVNKNEAAAAGLSVAKIGSSVRAAFEGELSSSIKKLDEKIEVRVSLPNTSVSNRSMIDKLLIPNNFGNLIPLGQVAAFREDQGIAAYIHEGNQREVKVLGEIDQKITNAAAISKVVEDKIPEYKKQFPNLDISMGGENEDTEESMRSLVYTFSIALLGIMIVLILTFQNLLQPLLVSLTIPIGFMAIQFTFLIHNDPNTFMGSLGIIALAGVIVNNAIVLMDFVNQLRNEGVEKLESIIRAAGLRLRPIFLTTVTTVVGILPTAYGIGGTDTFVVPIALALGWGLFFGSIMTIFFFPAMIAVLDDISAGVEKAKRFRRKTPA